ncbi:MAG: hypothetical protein HW389_3645, partial [Bacteroidetes bacterium]|nr:hypothetical protein [Bacteroidota bacterium]
MQKARPVAYGSVLFVLIGILSINLFPRPSNAGQDQEQPTG